MDDLQCRFCNEVFRDPVILDTVSYFNACKACALANVVGKGPVKLPGTESTVTIADESQLRPNITLSFLLTELTQDSDVKEKVFSLLDSLSLFSIVGYDPVPYNVESENSVDLVVQAPERFSTFVDLVAVVDFSASMRGSKVELLKETLRFFIQNLDENDRFGVVTFASGVHRLFEVDAATPKNKKRWLRKLTEADAKSKSNLCGGLLEGIDMLGNLKGRRSNATMVVFTDGQATKGVMEEEEILNVTKEALKKFDMRVAIHSFGYKRHQVTLMKRLTEIYTGQYFFIQSPMQIPESLAISFTDIRRSHFHDVTLTVEMSEQGGAIRQIGTKLPVSPIPGSTSMKKSCLVQVNQLAERRQKNILFKVLNPKLAAPSGDFHVLSATLNYVDTSLSLKRKQVIKVVINRTNADQGATPAPLPEKEEVTTQWNRFLTGTSLEQAAKLGKDSATHAQGVELLVKAMEATKRTDMGEKISNDSNSVFFNTLKRGKRLLEKHSVLDDSTFGKLIDMANAFLHEQSSVFVDAYNTEAVDEAITEVKEKTKLIVIEEEAEEGGEVEGAEGKKVPPKVKAPSTSAVGLGDGSGFLKVKSKRKGGEDEEIEFTKLRLNSYTKYEPAKQQELSELYMRLTKGNLTSQEIEARIERAKKMKQSEPMSELEMKLKMHRKKMGAVTEETYVTLRARKPKPLGLNETPDQDESNVPVDAEFTHQALHDFKARTALEVDLRQGDPLVLLKKRDDAFAEIENMRTRKTGLVPLSYLAIILISDADTTFPTHVALYDFTPRTEQEIELKKDDQIMVTKERNDGYYEGLNTRSETFGLFPSTHVAPRITHRALKDFVSGIATEVDLKVGDGIIVTKIRDDGWLQGQNVRTGNFGLIPSSYVQADTQV